MARDKAKDDKVFNCKDELEYRHVYNLYYGYEDEIKFYIKERCADETIRNFTHVMVYQLIKQELGLEIPE